MVVMTEPGTEKRLDDLREEVHRGFARVDAQTAQGFARVDAQTAQGFARVDAQMVRGFERADAQVTELRGEMHRGFERADAQTARGFARADADGRELRSEIRELRSDMKVGFESMHKLMIRFFAGTIGTVIAGVIVTVLTHS
jgi:hypothetical protein